MKGWVLLRAEWERVLGFLFIAIGGVGLLLGYRGVAESVFVGQQLAYVVSGGLGGIFLGAVGVGMLVSADLHDEWRKLDRIEAAIRGEVVPDATELLLEGRSAAPESLSEASDPTKRSIRVTAFSRVSLPERSSPGPAALAIDWEGDRLRRPLMGALAAVLLTGAVMAGGWGAAARSDTAIEGFRPVLVAGVTLAVGLLAISAYPLWVRVRLTQRKRRVLGEWLWQANGLRSAGRRSNRAQTATGSLVVADGLHRYHISGCPSLKGVATRPFDAESTDGVLPPCRICQPA